MRVSGRVVFWFLDCYVNGDKKSPGEKSFKQVSVFEISHEGDTIFGKTNTNTYMRTQFAGKKNSKHTNFQNLEILVSGFVGKEKNADYIRIKFKIVPICSFIFIVCM